MADFTSKPVSIYTLLELLKKTPQRDLDRLLGQVQEYNKTVIPDKQINQHHPDVGSSYRHAITTMEPTKGTNFESDPFKYIHPETRLLFDAFNNARYNGTLGLTRRGSNLAEIYNAGKTSPQTMIHEAHHADTNQVKGYNKYSPSSSSFLSDLTKEGSELYDSSNIKDSYDEILAEIRARVGMSPKGTTFNQIVGPALDKIDYSGKSFIPIGEEKRFFNTRPVDRNVAEKLLEQDVFPRERWIEPREPTVMERLQDLFKR